MSSSAGTKTKALCVATRCMTAEQFVATFHRFCDESSFFVATLNTRPVGLETPFAIQLADRTPVLRGLCVVLDAWTTPANQFNRPGIRLGIRRLTADSQQIFAKLQTRRAASANEPAPDELEAAASPALPVSHPPASATPAPGAALPKPPPLARTSGRPATDVRTPPPTPIVRPPELPRPPVTPTGPRPFGPPKAPSTLVTQPLSFIPKPPSIPGPGRTEPAAPVELRSASTMPMPAPAKLPAAPLELEPRAALPAPATLPDLASDAASDSKRAKSDTAPDATPDDRRSKPDTAPDHLRAKPDTAPDVVAEARRAKPDTAPDVMPEARRAKPAMTPDTIRDAARATPDAMGANAGTTRAKPDAAQAKPDPTQAKPDTTQAKSDTTAATPDTTQPEPDKIDARPDTTAAAPLDTTPAPAPRSAPSAPPTRRASRMPITPMRGNTASGLITPSALRPPPGAAAGKASDGSRRAAAARPADDEPTAQAAPLTPPVKPAIAPIVDLATYAALAEPSKMGTPPLPTDGRAPGSDLVLPANPLMNLTDESIEGFVDCTLYEETANFLSAPGADDDDELAPPPPPDAQATPGASPEAAEAEVVPAAAARHGVGPATMPPVGVATPPGMPAYDPDALRAIAGVATPPVTPAHDPGARPPTLPPWATPPGPPAADAPVHVPLSTLPPDATPPPDPRPAYEAPPPYASSAMPAASPGPFAAPPGQGYGPSPYPTGSYEAAAMNGSPMATPVPGYATGYTTGYAPGPAAFRSDASRRATRRWLVIAAPIAVVFLIVMIVIANTGSSASSPDPVAASGEGSPGSQAAIGATPTGSSSLSAPGAVAPARPAVATAPGIDAGSDDDDVAEDEDEGEGDGEGEGEDPDDPSRTIAGVPVVGDGPCLLTVSSTPAGSVVSIDQQSVGPSPIAIAGPCQRRRVDIKHPRYKRSTQWVVLEAEKQNSLDVRLVRPTHALKVTSIPSGATILIGGRRAGITPTVVQVMGFSGMKVTIKKPGYRSVTKRVYSKRSQDKLFVRLTR